jgi:hypothetical protein
MSANIKSYLARCLFIKSSNEILITDSPNLFDGQQKVKNFINIGCKLKAKLTEY